MCEGKFRWYLRVEAMVGPMTHDLGAGTNTDHRIRNLRSGDGCGPAAVAHDFFVFCDANLAQLYAFVRAQCPDPVTVDEVIRSTLLAARGAWSEVGRHADPMGWLMRTARLRLIWEAVALAGAGLPVEVEPAPVGLVARAVSAPRNRLAQARTRRLLRRIEGEYARTLAAGAAVGSGLDLSDPGGAGAGGAPECEQRMAGGVRDDVGWLARRDEVSRCVSTDIDPATGLFTQRRFADEVDRALRLGAGVVLVLRVEPVGGRGDRYGAPTGVELLRVAARLIEELTAPVGPIGRVGQSEIGVLLPDTSLDVAGRRTDCLVQAVRAQPFVTHAGRLRANVWGGLVRYSHDAQASSHDLLIDVEGAWRRAKELDRSSVWLAHPIRESDRKRLCRDRIADALRTGQFTLYAQPILELTSNQITRYEILLRVLDEVTGPMSPVAILDTAERLDAVFELDLWVLERAMELIASGPVDLHLQVNLSGRSLGDTRLVAAVDDLFERYEIDPAQLTFEITETAVIGNVTEAKKFARRVREIGCQLALDDFGSGYGSFRYLKIFPVDLVKIDGEFIENLVGSHEDQVMVSALVQVCQAYGIRTVAEFVQDDPTMELLRRMGVDLVQGYLIGEPLPISAGWRSGIPATP